MWHSYKLNVYFCFVKIYNIYSRLVVSLFENSMSVLNGQRILWTAVEKFYNLLMLLNLYFYITPGILFI